MNARKLTLATLVSLCALTGGLAPTPALALTNPERHYEMVSPVYKAGYGVEEIHAAAPDGESVAFGSLGGFAGLLTGSGFGDNVYLARRGAAGWSTVSLQPPFGGTVDYSANLEYALASAPLGANAGVVDFTAKEQEFLLHRTDAPESAENWEADGGIVFKRLDGGEVEGLEVGASGDLCHAVLTSVDGPLLPAAVNAVHPLYDVARGCDGEQPSLRLVALKNNNPATLIDRQCTTELGIGSVYSPGSGHANTFNAVAAGGDELFFTTGVEGNNCSGGGRGGSSQLFVRLDGVRTLEISRPRLPVCDEVPCAGAASRQLAYFDGASEDGSRVFFTTTQPLVGEDQDQGNDLYMATIGCSSSTPECGTPEKEVTSLVQVSHDPTAGEAAEVQGVTSVAADGSRVYFVAHGVLTAGSNVEGQVPVKGADNLYVYDSRSEKPPVLVADLCSGPGLSGVASDSRCPSNLVAGPPGSDSRNDAGLLSIAGPVQTAGKDGKFLVFSTYAQLLAGDTDNAMDVYRYDAETGVLDRVSVGEAGHDANGNREDVEKIGLTELENADATISNIALFSGEDKVSEQQEMATRAISEDGSRIVFSTAEPLSPEATNGLANIYEWHEGSVHLISSGSAEEADKQAVITPSGRDIFFNTSQGLVAQDTDGLYDIYDARLEGGFAPPPVPREPCSGDACQGPLTNPAPLLVPGSVSQAPNENLPVPSITKIKAKAKPKPKAKRKKKKKKKLLKNHGVSRTSAARSRS